MWIYIGIVSERYIVRFCETAKPLYTSRLDTCMYMYCSLLTLAGIQHVSNVNKGVMPVLSDTTNSLAFFKACFKEGWYVPDVSGVCCSTKLLPKIVSVTLDKGLSVAPRGVSYR